MVPENEGSKTFSKSFTPLSLTISLVFVLFIVGSLTVAIFAYTPLGTFFPVPDALLEKRYGTELSTLGKKLTEITNEFLIIQEYNLKLREALGEDTTRNTYITNLFDEEKKSKENLSENKIVDIKNSAVISPIVKYNFIKPKLPFSAPTGGLITREFNPEQKHFGIDYTGRIGQIISSVADGVVMFSGWNFEFGNTIIVNHGDGFSSVYKHNESLLKKINQRVSRGESIALLGSSGQTSEGAHLHFEIWKNGVVINPKDIIYTDRNF